MGAGLSRQGLRLSLAYIAIFLGHDARIGQYAYPPPPSIPPFPWGGLPLKKTGNLFSGGGDG